jgi:hypothetical protein
MRANEYMVMIMCVDRGVQMGWARAHKHEGNPDPNHVQDCINDAVLAEINEWFKFKGDTNEN